MEPFGVGSSAMAWVASQRIIFQSRSVRYLLARSSTTNFFFKDFERVGFRQDMTPLALNAPPSNERCSRQALFGCGFAAMVVACLQLNLGVRHRPRVLGALKERLG